MDHSLGSDNEEKIRALADHPDIDLHLRIQDHRVEGFVWSEGRRYRLLGVRDEEDQTEETLRPFE
jgi:hypothetical protein